MSQSAPTTALPTPPSASPPRPRDLVAVIIALVLPTIVTWVYFFQADAMPPQVQLTVFSTVKTLQFGFPLFWVLAIQRGRVTLRPRLNGRSGGGADPRRHAHSPFRISPRGDIN